MRLRELMKDIEKEELAVITDFSRLRPRETKAFFSTFHRRALEINNILIILDIRTKTRQ